MKQIFTLLSAAFLMLMALNLKAQDTKEDDDATASEKSKSYLSLGGGISAPYGNFKSTSYINNKSGFAKKGVVFSLDGAHYFLKRLALGYTVTYQDQGNFTTDDDAIVSQGYTDSYGADGSTITANRRYRSLNVLLGPQYSIVWHALTFDFRASAGAIKPFTSPEIAVALEGVSDQSVSFTQTSSKAFVFAYGGSAAIRLNTGAGWGLFVKGNYINSTGPKVSYADRAVVSGRTVSNQAITEGQFIFGLYKEF